LVKGLTVTFRAMLGTPVTILYPYKRLEIAPRYRGFMGLATKDEPGGEAADQAEGGELKCIGCLMCMKACPVNCISIEREKVEKKFVVKSYTIDFSRCTFCGGCVNACPVKGKAIVHTRHYEEVFLRREDTVFDARELIMVGRGLMPHQPLNAPQIEALRGVRQAPDKYGLGPDEAEALGRIIEHGFLHRVVPEELSAVQKLVGEGSKLGAKQVESLKKALEGELFEISTFGREEPEKQSKPD